MKIHCFQHLETEGLGAILPWIHRQQHQLAYTRFYQPDYQLPKPDDFDCLIILGGYMSVNDEAKFDWLKPEKQLIGEAIRAQKYVIGICLGSQLVANALGAKVSANPEPELGFWQIQFHNHLVVKYLPQSPVVFHWHNETFDLPAGAVRIAESSACINQGFIYQNKVLAMQFHLEMDEATLRQMLAEGLDNEPNTFVQSEAEIVAKMPLLPQSQAVLYQLLDNFLGV
jgi:GMP synthase-like glutamine amidotransferase